MNQALVGIVKSPDTKPGTYIVQHELDNSTEFRHVEALRRGVHALYDPGDRVLLIREDDQYFILGGLLKQTYHEDLAPIKVVAQPHINQSNIFSRISPTLQFTPQDAQELEITIKTDKPRFQRSDQINVWAGGDWRLELAPDRLLLIRIRDQDLTGPGSKQVKSDNWYWYDLPILSPDAYYKTRFTTGDSKYHTNPGMAIGVEFRIPPTAAVLAIPPGPPTSLLYPQVRQRTYAPHQHGIPTFDEIKPIRIVYRS